MRLDNKFLNSLSASDFALLSPHLTTVELSQKTVLMETGAVNETAYLPQTGVVSLVARLSTGGIAELVMVGNDGIIGGAAALSAEGAICDAIVQLPVVALAIRTTQLRKAAQAKDTLFEAIRNHNHKLTAQIVRSAGCIAAHSVDRRLARWLLRARTLAGDELAFTQGFMSEMLTVRRASVSVAAEALQDIGAIKYVRGIVTVIDAKKLKAAACECAKTDSL